VNLSGLGPSGSGLGHQSELGPKGRSRMARVEVCRPARVCGVRLPLLGCCAPPAASCSQNKPPELRMHAVTQQRRRAREEPAPRIIEGKVSERALASGLRARLVLWSCERSGAHNKAAVDIATFY
jgi:hypothetical protein